jgi:sugar phosphate isomerase/epimerase
MPHPSDPLNPVIVSRRRAMQAAGAAALGAFGSLNAAVADDGEASKSPKFKLGLVTYNVAKDWDLPTIIKICQSVGIAAVELRTTHKHGVETTLSTEQRREVRQRFADSGIVCWGCGSTCEFHSPDAAVVREQIETCKRFVDLVAEIGGRGVKVRPNGLPKEVPAEKTLEQIGKSLGACGDAASSAGVEIWLEVHGAETSKPAHCKTIMEHCGHSSVGLTWNSNGTDLVNGSVNEGFEMLWPWIRSCHINDLYNDRLGKYPYRDLFRLFRERDYDRYTLIEVGKTPADAAAGEEFLRYYKALWEELTRA